MMPTSSLQEWSLAFGQVRHTRLRPKRNAFAYPAFFLRVPIHLLTQGTVQSRTQRHGAFAVNCAAPMAFHEADHGDGKGCAEWIHGVMESQGIVADGPIWLLTFPRVWGYAFKPVSFWFCHNSAGAVIAIVAEVNNTFGERHIYLLAQSEHLPLGWGRELSSDKAFHVSPFCQVEGRYRFRFFDSSMRSLTRVDHDDEAGPLLLTSMSGVHQPLDASAVRRALVRYPLFTFGVVARIHWQAVRLWFKGVRFISKPAAPDQPVTTALQ
jgi:hypothetical protein